MHSTTIIVHCSVVDRVRFIVVRFLPDYTYLQFDGFSWWSRKCLPIKKHLVSFPFFVRVHVSCLVFLFGVLNSSSSASKFTYVYVILCLLYVECLSIPAFTIQYFWDEIWHKLTSFFEFSEIYWKYCNQSFYVLLSVNVINKK